MRIRGFVLIAAAIPAWAYIWYFWREASRIGYLESVPDFVIGVGWFSVLSPVIGISLLVIDAIKRRQRGHQ